MRHIARFRILATAALAAVTFPAHADFYRLDGRFECLGHADTVCFDKTPTPPDPFAPPLPVPSHAPLASQAAPTPPVATQAAHAATRPLDPILAVAARIERTHPDPGDLDLLRSAAAAGDPRAVELLAWCSLRGIGTGRDPLQAYVLYGKAAALDVPHARENQRLVFERSLSSAERERILETEAAAQPAPGVLSAADEAPRRVP
jgi:hypothetical protein